MNSVVCEIGQDECVRFKATDNELNLCLIMDEFFFRSHLAVEILSTGGDAEDAKRALKSFITNVEIPDGETETEKKLVYAILEAFEATMSFVYLDESVEKITEILVETIRALYGRDDLTDAFNRLAIREPDLTDKFKCLKIEKN